MNSKYAANRAGFASGLSTAPLASRHRRAGGGAVDNPAYWLHDHLIETTSRSGLLPNNSVVKSRWSLDGLSIYQSVADAPHSPLNDERLLSILACGL